MVLQELLEETLQGARYPMTRGNLIIHAVGHGATHEVLHVLYRIPEREYHSAADVWDEITRLQPTEQ